MATRSAGKHSSCTTRCWSLWRHCCCSFGIYPVLVAPIITASCLLSVYSSAGCKFVDLAVGFTPTNTAWNQSQAQLGFWTYENTNATGKSDLNVVIKTFEGDCRWYPSPFAGSFINEDRTWKVARVMAMVSGTSSVLSAILAWLCCITKVPVGTIWPVLMLPLTLVAFIAEGSKFLIFDIAVCQNAIWYPTGVQTLPQSAQGCSLGESAYFGIAAGGLMLVSFLFVCLLQPEERALDPNYGLRSHDDVEANQSVLGAFPKSEEYDELYIDDGDQIISPRHSDNYSDQETSVSSGRRDSFTPQESRLVKEPLEEPSNEKVSESRIMKMQSMQRSVHGNTDEELIEQFVSDLNSSYQM